MEAIKNICYPSFIEYFEMLNKKDLDLNLELQDLYRTYFKSFSCLPTVFFILDLSTGRFAHISDGFPHDMINCQKLLKELGVRYFLSLKHPKESEIQNYIFEKRFKFMNSIPLGDQLNYCYSNNYRVKTDNKTYRHILQHTIVAKSDDIGMPLVLSGVCIDISLYKLDNKITDTVSYRGENDKGEIIYQDHYFPDELKIGLTLREREIIKLILESYNNEGIADKLNISFHTVKTHRRNIREKTNTKNVAQLLKFSIENKI